MSAMVRKFLTEAGRNLRLAEVCILPERRAAFLAISHHNIQRAYAAWAQVAA